MIINNNKKYFSYSCFGLIVFDFNYILACTGLVGASRKSLCLVIIIIMNDTDLCYVYRSLTM